MPCRIPDEQMGRIVSAIVLPDAWMDRVLAQVHLADEVKRVTRERRKVEEQLKRLREVYLEGDLPREEYLRRKRGLDDRVQSLVVPGVDAAREAESCWKTCLPYGRRQTFLSEGSCSS